MRTEAATQPAVKLTPLMVRVVSGVLLLAAVVGLILLGRWGIWAIVVVLCSDNIASPVRTPSLGAVFSFTARPRWEPIS